LGKRKISDVALFGSLNNRAHCRTEKFGYFVISDEIRELLTAAVFFRFNDFSMSQFLSGSVITGAATDLLMRGRHLSINYG